MRRVDDALQFLVILAILVASAGIAAGANRNITSSSRAVSGRLARRKLEISISNTAGRPVNGPVRPASNLSSTDPAIIATVGGDVTNNSPASAGNGVAEVGPGDADASLSTRLADGRGWMVRGHRRRRDSDDFEEKEKTDFGAEDEEEREADVEDRKSVREEEEEQEEDSDAMKRDSRARDVNYNYIFREDSNEDSLEQARRDSGTSEEEKAEDLAMSKELVNILIKEVYNKLVKSGVAGAQANRAVDIKPVQAAPMANKVGGSSSASIFSKSEKPHPTGAKTGAKAKGKAKPYRHARAADLPTTSGAKQVTDAVESALFCHVLKKLAAEKVVESSTYDGFIAKKVCFNRRFRRETGCNDCTQKTQPHYPTIIAEVTCPRPAYLRLFPSVQVVHNAQVIREIPLGEFRATGGYTMDGFTPKDVNNNRERAALQFTFQSPVELIAFRFIQTRPHEKTSVSSLWVSLELAGEPDIWTSILDSVTKQALVMVVTSPLVQLPKPFTVTRVRIYPQSWPEPRDQPVLPFPVFIACHPATSDSTTGWSLVSVDKYDSWASILAAIFVN